MVASTISPHSPKSASESEAGPLILVSNRGSIEHYVDELGRIRQREAGGGVAVALSSVAKSAPVTWVAAACSFGDQVVALTGRRVPLDNGSSLRLVSLPDEVRRPYYGVFCNPLLWFVQHSLGGELSCRDLAAEAVESWQAGYVPANRLFADAVIAEVDRSPSGARVMLNDYHLYLAPRLIRRARPHTVLQQFIHIPWPEPSAWLRLPDRLVREICSGLLANDSVFFQTEAACEGFLATCRTYLGAEAEVDDRRGEVEYLGRTTSIWSNPISVDVAELRGLAASPQVVEYGRVLEQRAGRRTIVRVDRLDPSKNVLRGFQAYEALLRRRPRLRGRVKFLAFLVPSRAGIEEYDDYARRVFAFVDEVNGRYGTKDWQPISVIYEQNRLQALAALRLYDVLLVNSVADGMNLVSKEGPIVNGHDGVLVLSKRAGSYEELRSGAIGVDPVDVEGTARALDAALTMPPAERRRRATLLRRAVESHELSDWLRHQLKDLSITEYVRGVAAEPAGSRTVAIT